MQKKPRKAPSFDVLGSFLQENKNKNKINAPVYCTCMFHCTGPERGGLQTASQPAPESGFLAMGSWSPAGLPLGFR